MPSGTASTIRRYISSLTLTCWLCLSRTGNGTKPANSSSAQLRSLLVCTFCGLYVCTQRLKLVEIAAKSDDGESTLRRMPVGHNQPAPLEHEPNAAIDDSAIQGSPGIDGPSPVDGAAR